MRLSSPASAHGRMALVIGLLVILAAAATAFGATKAADTRALLLTERFTPDAAPAVSTPLATSLVALRGETEGFQLAIQAPGSKLRASLAATSDPFFLGRVRILRAGFVNVASPSAVVSLGAGT